MGCSTLHTTVWGLYLFLIVSISFESMALRYMSVIWIIGFKTKLRIQTSPQNLQDPLARPTTITTAQTTSHPTRLVDIRGRPGSLWDPFHYTWLSLHQQEKKHQIRHKFRWGMSPQRSWRDAQQSGCRICAQKTANAQCHPTASSLSTTFCTQISLSFLSFHQPFYQQLP
jgi:hypothetical protein